MFHANTAIWIIYNAFTGPVVFLLFPATVLTAKHRGRIMTWVASLILNFIIIKQTISIGLCTWVSRTKVLNLLYLTKLMLYYCITRKNCKTISINLWNSTSFRGVDLSKPDNGKPVDLPALVLLILYQNSSSCCRPK